MNLIKSMCSVGNSSGLGYAIGYVAGFNPIAAATSFGTLTLLSCVTLPLKNNVKNPQLKNLIDNNK